MPQRATETPTRACVGDWLGINPNAAWQVAMDAIDAPGVLDAKSLFG